MTHVSGPQRRVTDHVHPEYWEAADQHRFEDRISRELHGVKSEVKNLNRTMTLLLGAIAIVAFLLPIVSPFIRNVLQMP